MSFVFSQNLLFTNVNAYRYAPGGGGGPRRVRARGGGGGVPRVLRHAGGLLPPRQAQLRRHRRAHRPLRRVHELELAQAPQGRGGGLPRRDPAGRAEGAARQRRGGAPVKV